MVVLSPACTIMHLCEKCTVCSQCQKAFLSVVITWKCLSQNPKKVFFLRTRGVFGFVELSFFLSYLLYSWHCTSNLPIVCFFVVLFWHFILGGFMAFITHFYPFYSHFISHAVLFIQTTLLTVFLIGWVLCLLSGFVALVMMCYMTKPITITLISPYMCSDCVTKQPYTFTHRALWQPSSKTPAVWIGRWPCTNKQESIIGGVGKEMYTSAELVFTPEDRSATLLSSRQPLTLMITVTLHNDTNV